MNRIDEDEQKDRCKDLNQRNQGAYSRTRCFMIPQKLVHRSGSSVRPLLGPTYFDVVDPSPFYTKQAAPRGFLIRIVATYRAVRPPERAVQRAVTKGRTHAPGIQPGSNFEGIQSGRSRRRADEKTNRPRPALRDRPLRLIQSPRTSNLHLI